LLAGGFELEVARLVDGLVASGEAVCGGDVVDGGVEAFVVVVLDEGGDDTIGLFAGAGCLLADGVGLEGLVPTLDLTRLRMGVTLRLGQCILRPAYLARA
jgi:hypothetical protein